MNPQDRPGPAPESFPSGTLAIAAFCGGWTLMMLEILGGRLMAPLFGNSIHQWGALIGVVMTFMAAGYWTGGKLGDRSGAVRILRGALLTAAGVAAVTPWIGKPVLQDVAAAFGPSQGTVVAALVILGLPSFVLAMVSPICAGLSGRLGTAEAAGRANALGTLGSIGGTFFAAFVVIPEVGVSAGYGIATLLPCLAAISLPGRRLHRLRGVAVLLLGMPLACAAAAFDGRGYLVYRETALNTIMVRDTGRELTLHLNAPWITQSRLRKDGSPTGLYYDILAPVPALADGTRTLVLGLAGGAVTRGIGTVWPGSQLVGVEIDPDVVAVAREHFGLQGVEVVVADARRHVETSRAVHDLVVVDLYATASIPFFTATSEFFQAVAHRVAPGGVMAMNVVAPQESDSLLGPLAASIRTAFPSVFRVEAGGGNHLLIATKEARSSADLLSRLGSAPPPVREAAARIAATLAPYDGAGAAPFTDDHSDIERRGAAVLYGP